MRTLKSEGYEPDKYLSTTKALDGLKAQALRFDTLNGQWQSLQTERTRLLGELEKHEVSEKTALNEAVRRANASTEGSVLVKPIACPDRTHLRDVVLRRVSSQRKQLLETLDGDGFSPRSLVAAVRAGKDTLESEYGIRGAQADAIYAAGEAFLREFEEQSIGQAVDVSLDVGVGKKHDYRSLDDLSKGQKATALLLLLLAAAETPLVIDQPEDDLDNRFVFDHVVTRLRSLKGARQIIVSTHNANIPVLGDAELIVTLEGDGHKGWPSDGCTGSLDSPAVRDAAERILEGGRAAFDARRHLYGI